MKEKKARVEDAMHATKAAVEEGIVPGGGVALVRGGKALDKLKLEGDQAVGLQIIRRAIEEPMRWIATNAGQEGSIVVSKVKEQKNADEGFNAATEIYEDLVKAGVIDPAKVVRSALQNASSIASLLLTTEALVSEIPEEKKEPAAAATRTAARAWAGCTKVEGQSSKYGSKLEVQGEPHGLAQFRQGTGRGSRGTPPCYWLLEPSIWTTQVSDSRPHRDRFCNFPQHFRGSLYR